MLHKRLNQYYIILASQSPRRKELLQGLNIDFEVYASPCDEHFPENLTNLEIAEFIAKQKADVFPKKMLSKNFLLITADTIVCLDEMILGKPNDAADAVRMLRLLSGKKHEVITGVCITTASIQKCFSVKTDVYFKKLEEEEILFYVDFCKPFDKAGAYGIQEWIGYTGITRIDGSYFNVMGLPVQKLYEELTPFLSDGNAKET